MSDNDGSKTPDQPVWVEIIRCPPTSYVTRGKKYLVVSWHSLSGARASPEVQCDHGAVVYLSDQTIWIGTEAPQEVSR